MGHSQMMGGMGKNHPQMMMDMGGMHPGMMQPGMMQPGMVHPGMMHPGIMHPGIMNPSLMQVQAPPQPISAQDFMGAPLPLLPDSLSGQTPGQKLERQTSAGMSQAAANQAFDFVGDLLKK